MISSDEHFTMTQSMNIGFKIFGGLDFMLAVLTQVINMYTKSFKHFVLIRDKCFEFCAVNTSIHSMVWQSMEHRWELADLPSFSRIQYQKKKNSQTTFPTLKVDGLLKRKCNRKKSVQQSRIKELIWLRDWYWCWL